jgi:hypothetical protein
MGGVMYAGRKYVSTAQEAFSKRKQIRRYYTDKADAAEKESQQDWLNNRAETDYIFRSAAEKNRALYQAVREQIAAQQTSLAKRGITQDSATAQLLEEKTKLKSALQQEKTAKETADVLSKKNKEEQDLLAAQRKKILAQRKAANQKSKLWKIGKQLFSWLS